MDKAIEKGKEINLRKVLNDKMNIGEEGKAKGASSRGSNVLHVGTS
ncbi:16605_t:CDS:2 [Rhizophagus irregularis]|nr:16605_t:CDS:2 [Rhizophagus irregularis]